MRRRIATVFSPRRFRINVYLWPTAAAATRQQIKHFYGVKNQHKNESTPKKNKRRIKKKSTNVCLRVSVFLLLRRWLRFEFFSFFNIFFSFFGSVFITIRVSVLYVNVLLCAMY